MNPDINEEELANDDMSDDITFSDNKQESVGKDCERFWEESCQLWDIERLKHTGRTSTGLINPLTSTKKILKEIIPRVNHKSQIQEIDKLQVSRRASAQECERCAWPSNLKG